MFYIQIVFSFFLCIGVSLANLHCSLIPNCISCKDQLTCIRCNQGYQLFKNGCHLKQQKTQRFLQTSQSKSNVDPKNRKNTKANSTSSPLIKKIDDRVRFWFFSNPNDRRQASRICVYESKGICYICGSRYQMGVGGRCYLKFNKCLSFNQQLLCTKCHPHFVHEDGTCVDVGCIVKNYYQCNQCKNGYKLNQYSYCITLFCIQYQNGKCIRCMDQFQLKDDICVKKQPQAPKQIISLKIPEAPVRIDNCNKIQNQKCVSCNRGFYLKQQKCKKSPILCKNFDYYNQICRQCQFAGLMMVRGTCFDPQCTSTDQSTKQCNTCANGYVLNDSKVCQSTNKDQNCLKIVLNACTQCKQGYSLGKQNRCEKFQDNCIDKQCLYCKDSYISIKNKCQKILNCSKFLKNICELCYQGYSVTNIGTCVKSVQNCLKYTQSGCSKCPGNYILSNNQCVVNRTFEDVNCISKNFRSECSLCKSNYRLEPKYKNLCVPINRQCKSSSGSGECTSCYEGYRLNQRTGECIIVTAIQNCAEQADGVCRKCAHRYYLISSLSCKEVDSLCDNYNLNNGLCTSCYQGYILYDGKCIVVADFNSMPKSILLRSSPTTGNRKNDKGRTQTQNCLNWNKDSNKCIKCYESFFFNPQNQQCVPVNPLCKTYNQTTGSCLTCYEGYKISDASCVIEAKANIRKQNEQKSEHLYRKNCKKIDDKKNQCLECLDRYYKKDEICQQVSPQCRIFNRKTGACTGCYTGYILKQNQCKMMNSEVKPIQNCQGYHPSTLKCIKCSQNYVVKNNQCEQMPEGCLKYDQIKGHCAECVAQYMKNSLNLCIRPALGQIFNCNKYDDSGYCVSCGGGWVLQNYMCVSK